MGEQKVRILSVAAHTHDCARPSCQPMDLDSGLPELPQRVEVVVIGAGIVG